MTIDGIILSCIVAELRDKLLNGRVQKINQVNKNLLTFGIYSNKNYKLLISVDSQAPRMHITNQDFTNPKTPSNFTMVLRKHLNNSRLIDIKQVGLDRTVEFIFEARNELGIMVDRRIIVDLMGKYSNVVLLDENMVVIESIIRVSHDMSRVRAIYPGSQFNMLVSEKFDLTKNLVELNKLDIPDNLSIFKIFYMNYEGFSPTIGRELSYRANLEPKRNYGSLSEEEKEVLNNEFVILTSNILEKKYMPNSIFQGDKLESFYCLRLKHLGDNYVTNDSISKVVDEYYLLNTNDDSLNQSRKNLLSNVEKIIARKANKLDYMYADLEKSKDYDHYRLEGELLTAYIHQLKRGLTEVEVLNYYDNQNLLINLDSKKDGWQNIEQKYKLSKKFKRSFSMLKKGIPKQQEELSYLQEVARQISSVESHQELDEIKAELYDGEYIKKTTKKKAKAKEQISKPLAYATLDGSVIKVGKNNKQNEQLTLKEASKDDLFFHVKDLPGSHVIMRNDSGNFSQTDIEAAAYLAAVNSKHKDEKYLDVDYCPRKNVFKNKGAKPGMVYYKDFKTIRVNLEEKPINIKKLDGQN